MIARVVLALAGVSLAMAAGPMGSGGLPALRAGRAGVAVRGNLRVFADGDKTDDEPQYNDPDAVQPAGEMQTMSCEALRAMTLRGGAPEEAVVATGPKLQLVLCRRRSLRGRSPAASAR